MNFNWSELYGLMGAAVVFVFIKAFLDKKEGDKFFSYQMVIDILILTVLFQASTWLIAKF